MFTFVLIWIIILVRKEVMRVTRFEQLDEMLADYDGMLQTSMVTAAGISKTIFYEYAKKNKLAKVAHGIYVSDDAWSDAMYLLHLRCDQAVFSHETALFFHDLTDREPSPYSITVKTGYNPSRLKADGIKVYTVKAALHDIGITTERTPFGHMVPVYDMERTICDLIRNRNSIEMQSMQDALKQYVRRKDKNLRALMQYANLFHVDKVLKQYLEVLL